MRLLVCAIVLLTTPVVFAGEIDSRCSFTECRAGATVITYAKRAEPYYACQTMELAKYTNYVLALLVTNVLLTGGMPNISPATGDPEQLGESKKVLDYLREKSKVQTFDEAMKFCSQGKPNLRMMVANNPKDEMEIWVMDQKNNSFWMPKSHLNLSVK